MSLLCYPLFLLYKLFNMFRATMCPSSGADDWVVQCYRHVLVLCRGGCRKAVRTGQQVVCSTPQWTPTHGDNSTLRSRQLLKMGTWLSETCRATCKGEIKDNTKLTSSWFLIHTELGCTVNHTSNTYKCLKGEILYCLFERGSTSLS